MSLGSRDLLHNARSELGIALPGDHYGAVVGVFTRRNSSEDAAYLFAMKRDLEMQINNPSRARFFADVVAGVDVRRVLDVGCGVGQALLPLAVGNGAVGVGVDVSEIACRMGRDSFADHLPRAQTAFVRSQAESLPFPAATFDVVNCALALPYTKNRQALHEMSRVLRRGGLLILRLHHALFYIAMFWRGLDEAAQRILDGAEIAHPMILGDPISRAQLIAFTRSTRELNPRLAPIGSTDYHYRQPMGLCRTYVFAREYSEAGVIEAIRAGRTVAFDPEGGTYGAPELTEVVDRIRAAAKPEARWRRIPDAASAIGSMLGLVGLIASLFSFRDSAGRATS